MRVFKVQAEGDTLYIQAKDKTAAQARFWNLMGPIPETLLTWTEVKSLPEGEEFL